MYNRLWVCYLHVLRSLADLSARHSITMDEAKTTVQKKRSVAVRIARIVYKTVLIIVLLVALIALSILTPPVQNLIRGKAVTWLSNKLKTKVEIGKIYIGFPKKVVIEGIYLEDRAKDTLLFGGKLQVDIAMLKLLHSEVEVSEIQVADLTAKVKRVLPDTTYNFQFIIDAFASADTTSSDPSDTSGMKVSVKDIVFDRIRLLYKDDVTGNDITLGLTHFDTGFDVFDLDKMKFSIPETNLKGISAQVYQHKPIYTASPSTEPVKADDSAAAFDVSFKKLNLSEINVDYGNDVSALYSKVSLGALYVDADKVDMAHQTITLDNLALNNTTASVRMGKQQAASVIAAKADTAAAVAQQGGWRVLVKNVALDNNNIAFDNDNSAPVKTAWIICISG